MFAAKLISSTVHMKMVGDRFLFIIPDAISLNQEQRGLIVSIAQFGNCSVSILYLLSQEDGQYSFE